jgi:lipopolysaccharide exporter
VIVIMALLPLNYFVLARKTGLTINALIGVLWRPFLSVGIMSGSVLLVTNSLESSTVSANVIQLLAAIIIGALVYLFSVIGLWILTGKKEGVERQVVDELYKRWGYRFLSRGM